MWASLTAGLAGQLLAKFLLAAGVGLVTFLGFNEVLSLALSQAQGLTTGLPENLVGLLGWCHADVPVSAFFAAHSASLAMTAVTRFMPK